MKPNPLHDVERQPPLNVPSAAEADAPTDLNLRPMAAPTPVPPVAYSFLSPPERSDEIGRLALYRVVRLLGEGGMGLVFKAEDVQLQRPVALKIMRPEKAKDEEARQRFLREARAIAKVQHDNIVSIHQVGEANGVPYIAMQYLRGMSLGGFLDKYKAMTLAQIVRVGREVALGLAAAHKHGLIHRDVKPDNIWLEAPNGRVKLLDFGLARQCNVNKQLTQSGFIVGTPQFMSPEQARNHPLDQRSDLFSLGVVLYLLCTGRLAFHGDTLMATLTALAVDEPQPVEKLNPAIPSLLTQLIGELLAKKPKDRPANAEEVALRLETLERGQAVGSGNVGEAKLTANRSWLGRGAMEVPPLTPDLDLSTAVLKGAEDQEAASLAPTLDVKRASSRLWPLIIIFGVAAIAIVAAVLLVLTQFGDDPTAPKPVPTVQARQTLTGHLQRVRWVAVSPDGKTVASASFDGAVRLWDLATGTLVKELRGHQEGVESVVFHPTESKLASGSYDGTVRLWDVSSGECYRIINVHRATVTGLGISPDGKILACGGGDRLGQYDVYLYDLATGERLRAFRGLDGHVTCAEFSPDGRFLVTSGVNAVIRVWNLNTGREHHILRGHHGAVEHASFSPDGKCLASASRDGTLRVWDMATGRELRSMSAPAGFWCVRYSPNGRLLASAGINGEVRLWDGLTGEHKATLVGHTQVVFHVTFTPDSRTLVSSGRDGNVKVWDVAKFALDGTKP